MCLDELRDVDSYLDGYGVSIGRSFVRVLDCSDKTANTVVIISFSLCLLYNRFRDQGSENVLVSRSVAC